MLFNYKGKDAPPTPRQRHRLCQREQAMKVKVTMGGLV